MTVMQIVSVAGAGVGSGTADLARKGVMGWRKTAWSGDNGNRVRGKVQRTMLSRASRLYRSPSVSHSRVMGTHTPVCSWTCVWSDMIRMCLCRPTGGQRALKVKVGLTWSM